MTDIIECENELNKYLKQINLYYPYIANLLSRFNTKSDFLQSIGTGGPGIRKEWYNLYGYPETLPDNCERDIVYNFCRINGYPREKVLQYGGSLFTEWCVYNQVASLSIDEISSDKGRQLKYIHKDTTDEERARLDNLLPMSDISNLKLIRLHQHKKGTAEALAEAAKKVKYNDTNMPDSIKAWKRTRQIVEMFMEAQQAGVADILKDHIPAMKLVKENVFSNVEGDLKALTEIKKLIALLPYEKNEDKLFLLNYIDHFMEMKDIVNMLPQYKDNWNNGRLVFEIGDDSKDLFKPYKGVMNTKYFIITVNPVDMLFCSTDQEYHSCFGLDSPHGSNKGLINFLARPDTCMCFLSSGSLSKPWKDDNHYKGLTFNHIKIKARAFIYNSVDKHMADVGRCYAPYELSNIGISSLGRFRTDARLWLWHILQEADNGFDLTPYVTARELRSCLATNEHVFNPDFTFNTAGLILRRFKKHPKNEVYFDNLSFNAESPADNGTYYSIVGRGCCSRFNAREGNLGDLYTQELQKVIVEKDD